MQCFIWCPVCFSKMELMSYLGKTARVISKRDNNLSNPTKSRYFWDIGANVRVRVSDSSVPDILDAGIVCNLCRPNLSPTTPKCH